MKGLITSNTFNKGIKRLVPSGPDGPTICHIEEVVLKGLDCAARWHSIHFNLEKQSRANGLKRGAPQDLFMIVGVPPTIFNARSTDVQGAMLIPAAQLAPTICEMPLLNTFSNR